jgi:hypothetical protein
MHFWLRLVYKRSRYRELIIEGASDSATRWSHCPIDDDGTCVRQCQFATSCGSYMWHRSIDSHYHLHLMSQSCVFSIMCFLLSLQLSPLFLGLLWSAIQKSRRLQWPSHPRSQSCLDECGGATPRPVTGFLGDQTLDLSNGSGDQTDLKLDLLDFEVHLKSI